MDTEDLRDTLDLKKLPELKELAKSRGLKVSGRTRELVDRLVDSIRGGSRQLDLGESPTAPRRRTPRAAKSSVPRTGDAALAAPPVDLATMGDDSRAEALWYRAGDNSEETGVGRPGAFEMNDQLRSRRLDPEMKRRVKAIDSVMAESQLDEPIIVYRGFDPESVFRDYERLAGREFTERAFASTTTDPDHAIWFGGHIMRIRVPAGVGAIRMADRGGTERDSAESEILLDRGLRFRIVRHYDRGELKGPWSSDSAMGRAHILDVEVVPKS
jgi:hypothetical protein